MYVREQDAALKVSTKGFRAARTLMASRINPPKLTAVVYAALLIESGTPNNCKKLFLFAIVF